MGKVKEFMRRMSLKGSSKKSKTDLKAKADAAPIQAKVEDMPEATVAVAKAAEPIKQVDSAAVPTVAASQVPEVTTPQKKAEVQAALTPAPAAPEVPAAVTPAEAVAPAAVPAPHPVAYAPSEPTKVEPVVPEVAHEAPVVRAYEPVAATPAPADVPAPVSAGPVMHTFEYDADEKAEVYLVGSFDEWQSRRKMQADGRRHNLTVPLAPGTYQYKFVVNGEWVTDQSKPQEWDGAGNTNNTITL